MLADRVLGGTPYFNLFTLAVDLAVPTTGFVIWIRRGHSWLAALSWSVPLGVLCSGIALVPDLAPILRLTAAEICILLGVGMVIIPEFMSWWYARILRASPPN